MVYLVFYNGFNVEKKFSKEYLNHIYYDQIAHSIQRKIIPDLKNNVDWERSSRKQLHVLNRDVYKRLLKCDGRYYWPNGYRFLCRPYKTRRQAYHEHERLANHTNSIREKKYQRIRSPSSVDTVKYPSSSTPIPDSWYNNNNNDDDDELEQYGRLNGYHREKEVLEDGEIFEN
ncbi:late expression factor-6 [Maruca vitrata nucleopolyhedrovirus]|uniref:Late expression factor-6 n=1 Tax=Maruca vitrata nucleopolyhedrovirus TaxID=1307954 RepID=A1YR81_9ABAC|nr:late expression factor-6 [Maruca vitrata nucleopolyhedrovirus]ABL75971.1 late expression factor-6 [Maruca vitrata nucleopolyhedrovirus]